MKSEKLSITPADRVLEVKEYYFSRRLREIAELNAKGARHHITGHRRSRPSATSRSHSHPFGRSGKTGQSQLSALRRAAGFA